MIQGMSEKEKDAFILDCAMAQMEAIYSARVGTSRPIKLTAQPTEEEMQLAIGLVKQNLKLLNGLTADEIRKKADVMRSRFAVIGSVPN